MTAAIMTKIAPFLNKLIPAGLAIKGMSKLNPNLNSFITNAVGAGFAAENIVDYIRDKMSPSGDKMERERLESSSQLTPQEKNALGKRKQEGAVGSAIGAGVGIAAGLGGLGRKEDIVKQGLPPIPTPQKKGGPQPPQPSPQVESEMQRRMALKQFNNQKKPKLGDELAQMHQQQYGQGQPQQMSTGTIGELVELAKDYLYAGEKADPKSFQKFASKTLQHVVGLSESATALEEAKKGGISISNQGQQSQGGQGQQALMAMLQKLNQTRGGK